MRKKLYSAFLILCLAACSARGALSFASAENFPNIGLCLPRLSRAHADPVPMPEAHTFLPVNHSDTLTREDRFSPYELWYADQCCARWMDEYGNRLIIARMTHRFPDFPSDPETGYLRPVSREAFSLELARSRFVLDPKKGEQVDEWIATFVPAAVYRPEKLDLNSFTFAKIFCYSNDANLLVYAFLPRKVGNKKQPDWFCVTAELAQGEDPATAKAVFEEDFLSAITVPGQRDTKGVKAGEVFPEGEKRAPSFPYSPIRAAAKKSIENYDDWWIAETDGYVILSDVYSEIGKGLLRDLQKRLPVFQKAFTKLLPPLDTQPGETSVIRVFQHQADYKRYVGEDMEWSGAVWMPTRRELVLFQNAGLEEMMPTVQHEAFHQYLSFAYAFLQPAPWFNEGHACFFEGATLVNAKKVLLDPDLRRLTILLDNLDLATARIPLVLAADYKTFYGESQGERLLNYATAWGICYYLQKGVPSLVSPKSFYGILERHAAALRGTRDGAKATLAAFDGVEMKLFQEKFREFWLRDSERAFKYNPLKE
ncbi:MAG: hypothetical protein J6Z49_11535 [Kiritimatiellae bacterium]|nr:hypothetical protein [Kiritimatiellia bacterium]